MESPRPDVTAPAKRPADRRRAAATAPSLAVDRLAQMVTAALGPAQRAWLLGRKASPVDSAAAMARGGVLQRGHAGAAAAAGRAQATIERILDASLDLLTAPGATDDLAAGNVDLDWAAIFWALAESAASPRKQALWAHLLAAEALAPGHCPAIALRRLSELTADDLERFDRLAAFAIKNFVARLPNEFFDRKGVSQDDILYLEELGLLRTNREMSKVFQSQNGSQYRTHLLYRDVVLRVENDDPTLTLTLPCYRLTEAGARLAQLMQDVGGRTADGEFILDLIKLLQKRGFRVHQAAILEQRGEVVSRHSDFCEMFVLATEPLPSEKKSS